MLSWTGAAAGGKPMAVTVPFLLVVSASAAAAAHAETLQGACSAARLWSCAAGERRCKLEDRVLPARAGSRGRLDKAPALPASGGRCIPSPPAFRSRWDPRR